MKRNDPFPEWESDGVSVYKNISIVPKLKMNVYKVPSAVFSMNIFNIAEESRFAHQYSHFSFIVNINDDFEQDFWPEIILHESYHTGLDTVH